MVCEAKGGSERPSQGVWVVKLSDGVMVEGNEKIEKSKNEKKKPEKMEKQNNGKTE